MPSKGKVVKKKASKQRSGRLPGMEDAGIPKLEQLAEELSDTRSERIALSKREEEIEQELLVVMKEHGKIEYHHEDVHAWREISEEKVKVKIGELSKQKSKQIAESVDAVKQYESAEKEPAKESGETGQESAQA